MLEKKVEEKLGILNAEGRDVSDELEQQRQLHQKFFLEHLIEKYEVNNLSPESWGNEKMTEIIKAEIPNNPDTKKPADWTECRNFNLMLDTHL